MTLSQIRVKLRLFVNEQAQLLATFLACKPLIKGGVYQTLHHFFPQFGHWLKPVIDPRQKKVVFIKFRPSYGLGFYSFC